jgi:anti-sigma B factor antagonist
VSYAEPRFRTHERDVDERTSIIAVEGEIHVSTAPEFSGVLAASLESGHTRLVLDLSGVMFIDSTGLSVLLNTLRRVTRAGGAMALVCSNPTVLRLFEITKLDSTFDIQPTRDAAIARVQAAGAASSDGAA